jgi:FkbM family methyltransferase
MIIKSAENLSFSEKIQKIGVPEEIKNSIINPYKDILNNIREVYIFGAKELGKKFCDFFAEAGIKVLGFIDNDPEKQGKEFCGCKIININSLQDKKDKITVVIASIYYLYEIGEQLKEMGFKKVIPCPVFYVFNSNIFKAEPSFDGLVEDLAFNKQKYLNLYNILQDEKSKKVLNTVVDFRLTFDFSLYNLISDKNQYFSEAFINFGENDIFVDGGGFDGDTTLNFIKKVNNKYNKILFFEPDEDSFLKAKENLKNVKNIEFFKKGLYSKSEIFRFNSSGGLGSSIDENGNTKIEVVSIDEILSEKADYIKMDIEGAEPEALKGAEKQLKYGVKLAISLYHKSDDIWKIPELIQQVNPGYKFYLRHYTNSIFETVLYAITK